MEGLYASQKNNYDTTCNYNSVLINGVGQFSGNSYANVSVDSNKTYRLRIINGASGNYMRFSIENHNLTIVSGKVYVHCNSLADGHLVEPYVTDTILIQIGQRYDVLIHTDQPVSNYYINAVVGGTLKAYAALSYPGSQAHVFATGSVGPNTLTDDTLLTGRGEQFSVNFLTYSFHFASKSYQYYSAVSGSIWFLFRIQWNIIYTSILSFNLRSYLL